MPWRCDSPVALGETGSLGQLPLRACSGLFASAGSTVLLAAQRGCASGNGEMRVATEEQVPAASGPPPRWPSFHRSAHIGGSGGLLLQVYEGWFFSTPYAFLNLNHRTAVEKVL